MIFLISFVAYHVSLNLELYYGPDQWDQCPEASDYQGPLNLMARDFQRKLGPQSIQCKLTTRAPRPLSMQHKIRPPATIFSHIMLAYQTTSFIIFLPCLLKYDNVCTTGGSPKMRCPGASQDHDPTLHSLLLLLKLPKESHGVPAHFGNLFYFLLYKMMF